MTWIGRQQTLPDRRMTIPHMNLRLHGAARAPLRSCFRQAEDRDQVKDTFFEKGVRDDQVRVIPVGKEPTASWQVQMLDGMADENAGSQGAPGFERIRKGSDRTRAAERRQGAHSESNRAFRAKRFASDVYVWEQEGHIIRVETNGKKRRRRLLQIRRNEAASDRPAGQQHDALVDAGTRTSGAKGVAGYIKHWDQIHTGMLGAVGGAGRFMPRHMGGGGGPRSAWQEPIGSRSRQPGRRPQAFEYNRTVAASTAKTIHRAKSRNGRKRNARIANPPPMKPPPPGPKAPAADPAGEPTWTAKISLRARAKRCRARLTASWESRRKDRPRKFRSLPKQSGATLSKQQVYDVFNADRGRISWSMNQAEHVRQWQHANPGTKEPPPAAFTTRDGRVQASEEMWLRSGEPPLWGYEPAGPSDSGPHSDRY